LVLSSGAGTKRLHFGAGCAPPARHASRRRTRRGRGAAPSRAWVSARRGEHTLPVVTLAVAGRCGTPCGRGVAPSQKGSLLALPSGAGTKRPPFGAACAPHRRRRQHGAQFARINRLPRARRLGSRALNPPRRATAMSRRLSRAKKMPKARRRACGPEARRRCPAGSGARRFCSASPSSGAC
jgi:hypothetical protein